jgi:hypothetical protein
MKLEFSIQIFNHQSNIKLCENSDCKKNRRTDMTKLIIPFLNLVKPPENVTNRLTGAIILKVIYL